VIKLIWDEPFLKTLKKWQRKHPDLRPKLQERISEFCVDPYQPLLRTHKLSGLLDGYWAFSVSYEYRIVFRFIDDTQVLLIDIGTHNEVY